VKAKSGYGPPAPQRELAYGQQLFNVKRGVRIVQIESEYLVAELAGLMDCAHCKKLGTCESGGGGKSCAVCIAYWRKEHKLFQDTDGAMGLICSSCKGKGAVEPHGAARWDYRYPAALATLLALFSFLLLFFTYFVTYKGGEAFNKSLVFVGTLLGSVTGYYFGRERNTPAQEIHQHPSGGNTSTPQGQD
jgi:hypothetical protein